MPSSLDPVWDNAHYAFVAAGIVWLAFAIYEGSVLLLWPVAALVAAGVMLKMLPGRRLTWAWAISAATLGLVIALYQIYVAIPLLSGAFTIAAASSVVVFVVFGAAHVVLAYAGATATRGA